VVPGKYEAPDTGKGGGGAEDDANKEKEALEAMYGQEREEDYAKNDPLVNRLRKAQKPEDIAAVAEELIPDFENVHFGDSVDRFTFTHYKGAALRGQRIYEKDLVADGIIDGEVGDDGYLKEGGVVRVSGYSIRVETKKVRGEDELEEVYHFTPAGEKAGMDVVKRKGRPELKERVYFGTKQERKAMAKAFEALHQQLIVAEELQNQTVAFDKTRAALEAMVEQFYRYQIYFTNLQTQWFFSAADISKITPEKTENSELGKRRDKAMRLYYFLGVCETKEKMEKHLNETRNLEKILDKETIESVLRIAKEHNSPLVAGELDTEEKKFDAAAKFLIGPNLEIDRTTRKDHLPHYTLKNWLTQEQRDPMPIIKTHVKGDDEAEFKYEQSLKGKGAGAVGEEFKAGERGYLTELGNPYAEDSRDNLYVLMERMSIIVGDEMAVTDAGRYFWTRGMRDELGLELYTAEENFPTGEELLDDFNKMTDEERGVHYRDLQKLVALNGEPVGSDLSKIIHTKWWRFKELIRDRPAGPQLTYDKFDHMILGLLSLCRTEIDSGEQRSIKEQWLGFKSPDDRPNEEAKDLGEIAWEKVKIPKDVKSAVELNGEGVRDNADGYYWVMAFLSSEENVAKRPYQFIMKGIERPGEMTKTEAYTEKIKFWAITRHDAVAIGGDWRGWYARFRVGGAKFAEFMAGRRASEDVSKGKKDWYAGIRSTSDYPSWAAQDITILDDNGIPKQVRLGEVVENMAVKFGFLNSSEVRRALRAMKRLIFK